MIEEKVKILEIVKDLTSQQVDDLIKNTEKLWNYVNYNDILYKNCHIENQNIDCTNDTNNVDVELIENSENKNDNSEQELSFIETTEHPFYININNILLRLSKTMYQLEKCPEILKLSYIHFPKNFNKKAVSFLVNFSNRLYGSFNKFNKNLLDASFEKQLTYEETRKDPLFILIKQNLFYYRFNLKGMNISKPLDTDKLRINKISYENLPDYFHDYAKKEILMLIDMNNSLPNYEPEYE